MTGLRIGSLFSGYGGLDIGVQAALGGSVVWHCEIDPGASKILANHWPDVPNLGDITRVDWSAVKPVNVLTGGFPCTDVSLAGGRAGLHDGTRSGLWAYMAEAIDQLRPSLVVIENVRGLLSASAGRGDAADPPGDPIADYLTGADDAEASTDLSGDDVGLDDEDLGDDAGRPVLLRALGAVLGDLADIGYDAAWTGLRAADVGAPHGRFRVFVVAWPAAQDADGAARSERGIAAPRQAPRRGARPDAGRRDRAPAADADDAGRSEHSRAVTVIPELAPAEHAGGSPTDATGDGRDEGRPESARVERGPDAAQRGSAPADTDRDPVRKQSVAITGCGGQAVAGLAGTETAPDADVCGCERLGRVDTIGRDVDGRGGADTAWGDYEPAVRRWEEVLRRPAPAPTEPGRNGPRLSPTFVEWLMGLPLGHVTGVRTTRNDQLKALGNGVVPQQAAEAIRRLLGVAGEVAG